MPIPLAERFWSKVEPEPNSGCWLWTAGTISDGYGSIRTVTQQPCELAHRVAFRFATGIDAGERFVLHSCDNRRCVNPAHLSLGDNDENMRHRDERGRTLRGSRSPVAKLTEDAVRSIRARAATGERLSALAREYGLHYETLRMICRHPDRFWRHVTEAA